MPKWPSDSSPFSVAAAETPAETDRSGVTGAPGRHSFIKSANPRIRTCARCEKARQDPVHGSDPELRRTSIVGHLNLAIKAAREADMHLCAIHVGTAQKILEGDD